MATPSRSRDAKLRVAIIGLGKLGVAVGQGLVARSDMHIVAAVDADPAKIGRDLGELLDVPSLGLSVQGHLAHGSDADIAIILTASRMMTVKDTVMSCVRLGMNVLTSAEELAYPWHEFPDESGDLDSAARKHGVSILSAGANPGFVMDVVPLILTTACQAIRRLTVTRCLDLRPQRGHRLERFGLGVDPAVLSQDDDALYGHVGFRQSIEAVADTLGFQLDVVHEERIKPIAVATARREGKFFAIERGGVAVVEQTARGEVDGETVIDLHEYFGFLSVDDEIPQGDTFVVEGTDQSFTVAVEPGMLSFTTTPAVLINLTRPTVDGPPGLLSSIDFPIREFGAKGSIAVTGGRIRGIQA